MVSNITSQLSLEHMSNADTTQVQEEWGERPVTRRSFYQVVNSPGGYMTGTGERLSRTARLRRAQLLCIDLHTIPHLSAGRMLVTSCYHICISIACSAAF